MAQVYSMAQIGGGGGGGTGIFCDVSHREAPKLGGLKFVIEGDI